MKKVYQKATMKVVGVETESHLLSGSAEAGTGSFVRADYTGFSMEWN